MARLIERGKVPEIASAIVGARSPAQIAETVRKRRSGPVGRGPRGDRAFARRARGFVPRTAPGRGTLGLARGPRSQCMQQTESKSAPVLFLTTPWWSVDRKRRPWPFRASLRAAASRSHRLSESPRALGRMGRYPGPPGVPGASGEAVLRRHRTLSRIRTGARDPVDPVRESLSDGVRSRGSADAPAERASFRCLDQCDRLRVAEASCSDACLSVSPVASTDDRIRLSIAAREMAARLPLEGSEVYLYL